MKFEYQKKRKWKAVHSVGVWNGKKMVFIFYPDYEIKENKEDEPMD